MKLILRVAHKYAIGEIIVVSNRYQDFIIYGVHFSIGLSQKAN